jgi:integrase
MLNLAQLDTLISISPEFFPKRGDFDARRAVARIAQGQGVDLAALPAAEAPALLEQIKHTLPGKEFSNVRPNLARALDIDPLPVEVLDRIRRGDQTLADTLLAVERQETLATTGRVPGALRHFAETLSLRLEAVPATMAFVEEKFAGWSPTLLDMSDENFANFRWRVRRGVGLVDLASRQHRKLSQLTGPWADLAAGIRPKKKTKIGPKRKKKRDGAECWLAGLAPLTAYCQRHDIAPLSVSDATIKAVHADLVGRGVANPLESARKVVYSWEALQRAVPGFPPQILARVYKLGFGGESVHKVRYRQLPEAFRASFNDYVSGHFGSGGVPASMADLIPDADVSFAEMAETLSEPTPQVRRKDTAVKDFRTVLTYAANVAMSAGEAPQTVYEVATAAVLPHVMDAIWSRQQRRGHTSKRNKYLYNAATNFIGVGRDGGLPAAQIDRMILLRDAVDPHFIKYAKGRKRDGTLGTIRVRADWMIGPRHAARLRQFNDENVFKKWFQLPYLLLAEVKNEIAKAKPSKAPLRREIINDAIVALYHGVARCAPVRRDNFCQLRMDGREVHLDLPKTAGTPAYIVVPAAFTKNAKELTIELHHVVADWFRLWMAEVRPHCAGAVNGNPYVFPADAGGHRDAGDINKIFGHRNWKRGGFRLNTQVCRHLAAKIILDKDPSKMPLVQTLLGHKSLKVTSTYYGQVNQIIAQRWFQDALAETARNLGVEAI